MMFVTAAFFSFLGPLLLGIILDYFGPRVCSLTSIFLICIGCVLFGLSDRDQRPYFLPALCLIAFGGPGAQSAIIHLANLFPNWKATTTAFLTGSFQLSFIIFLIFDQLWLWKNISYSQLFFGYTFICLLNAVVSFWLWPDTPYSFEEQLAEVEEISEIDDDEVCCTFSLHYIPFLTFCVFFSLLLDANIHRSYQTSFGFHSPQSRKAKRNFSNRSIPLP